MGAPSFLLVVFHLICFSAMGVLVGFQYIYAIERDLKGINKNSYFIYFTSIVIALFLVWVLAITGGLEKGGWKVDLLPIASIIMGFYLPTKILFKKKRIRFSIRKQNHETWVTHQTDCRTLNTCKISPGEEYQKLKVCTVAIYTNRVLCLDNNCRMNFISAIYQHYQEL